MVRPKSKAKSLIIHVTPDQGWAWVISISCGAINGITFGLLRSYGVLFFQLLDTYSLSREAASWPFCLCTTFTHLSGPVAGLLLSRFSMRVIVFVGSLIAAFGIIICYFATSIIEITIYIGVIQGFGIGLSFMQTPVILAQYFEKFRATATAISYAGGTIGSFIFPSILEYILLMYGLKGCYLIIGAIMLNSLPFALLLRPATPVRNNVNKLLKGVQRQFSINVMSKDKTKDLDIKQKEENSLIISHMSKCNCNLSLMEMALNIDNAYDFVSKVLIESSEQLEEHMEGLIHPMNGDCICIEKQKYFEEELEENIINDKSCQTEPKTSKLNENLKEIYSVLSNPLYLILCLTHVSFQWAWMTHQMIIVDYTIDRGFSTTQAVVLLSCFAVADLFGRLTSGLAADKNMVRKRNVVSICILLIGVLLFMTPMATSFITLLVMTIALGFVSGNIIVLFSILTMEYVGLDRLPIALGTSAFIVGASTLVRPIVVGYFRDSLHSYDGLFQFVGILALLAALLWVSEPFARLWIERRTKYGNGFKVMVV